MIDYSDIVEDEFADPAPTREQPGAMERWAAWVLLGAAFLLRLFYIWHYRIDSDEPQHLHVVWGWTQGLLPYQSVFDNHSPLFQALYAPLFHLLGQRADIILPMRAGELPLYALTIFCVWKIARVLFSPRIALWTAVLAALCPPFYFDSIEFRPDQLWTLVWLLLLLVLVAGRLTPRRVFLAGLLCGTAFCVSMKSSLFVAALVQALIGALIVRWWAGGLPLRWPRLWRCALLWLAGLIIVPGLVLLFFHLHGALGDLIDCVIRHNVLPGASRRLFGTGARKTWLLGAVVAVAGGCVIARLRMPIPLRTRIGFVFFAAWLYGTTLVACWPVLTAEDYLPFYPAMALTVAPALLWLTGVLVRSASFPVGPVFALVELVAILFMVSPFQDQTVDKIGMVADTLKLTDPDDYVMDSKGETIYRRRPFRYVLESLTTHRLKDGLLPDTIADELIKKRVPLAATTQRMPSKGRKFIKRNYVPIAFRLWVLGQKLTATDAPTPRAIRFGINVPQRYTLTTPDGQPGGLLDGTPFTGPRELAVGVHTFAPEGQPKEIVLIWAQAIERNYSPFTPIKKDYKTEQD
jgi:hypothetical protein